MTCDAIAAMRALLLGKWRYTPPADTPAAATMSSIEVAWNPLRVNCSRAASRILARRSSRVCGVMYGMWEH